MGLGGCFSWGGGGAAVPEGTPGAAPGPGLLAPLLLERTLPFGDVEYVDLDASCSSTGSLLGPPPPGGPSPALTGAHPRTLPGPGSCGSASPSLFAWGTPPPGLLSGPPAATAQVRPWGRQGPGWAGAWAPEGGAVPQGFGTVGLRLHARKSVTPNRETSREVSRFCVP